MRLKFPLRYIFLLALAVQPFMLGSAQDRKPLLPDSTTPHRTRLILKDGSYQIVMSYRVVGDIVRYVSAERGGAQEEIPASLVDFNATRKWEQDQDARESGQAPVLDPELAKEEAERASFTPEIAPDLNLPEDDSVLVLDTYQGTPELVPLAQSDGDLNRNTSHNIIRGPINPQSSPHQIAELKGEGSVVQLHVDDPVIYLRIGDAAAPPSGGAPLVVDTHGAGGTAPTASAGGSSGSRYVIVRTDVRIGARVVSSFRINLLGIRPQPDVIETTTELLPGGHWMKITTRTPLDFGEFALMEVLSDRDVNLGVWDFGVHPTAPENRDVLKPRPRRRSTLERRRPD